MLDIRHFRRGGDDAFRPPWSSSCIVAGSGLHGATIFVKGLARMIMMQGIILWFCPMTSLVWSCTYSILLLFLRVMPHQKLPIGSACALGWDHWHFFEKKLYRWRTAQWMMAFIIIFSHLHFFVVAIASHSCVRKWIKASSDPIH